MAKPKSGPHADAASKSPRYVNLDFVATPFVETLDVALPQKLPLPLLLGCYEVLASFPIMPDIHTNLLLYIYIYTLIYRSVNLSICLSIYLSVCLFIYPSTYLPIYLFINVSIYLFIYLFMLQLYVKQCVYI